MPRGPFGGRRPGAKSILQLRIREIPVPTDDNEGVLPDNILGAGDDESQIIDDITNRYPIAEDRLSVDRKVSVQRGLGQTTVWTINVEVDEFTPSEVNKMTNKLSDAGYVFEETKFE